MHTREKLTSSGRFVETSPSSTLYLFADSPFTLPQGLRMRKRGDWSVGMSDSRKEESKEEIKSMADAERGGTLITPGGHD